MSKLYLAALGLVTLLGPSAVAQDVPPIGHWPFDDAQGLRVADASGNGRHGEILNDGRGAKWVSGRRGGAMEFTGDAAVRGQSGCIALHGLETTDWSKGMTVELWVLLNALDRAETYEIVSNSRDDRGPGFRLMISWLRLWLRSGEGGGLSTWGAATDPSQVQLSPGQWYHLAGTYDGSRFRVYVDGALCGESPAALTLPPGEGTVCVGAYHGGYAYGLNGLVDDLRLYSYARSPAQIMLDARLAD